MLDPSIFSSYTRREAIEVMRRRRQSNTGETASLLDVCSRTISALKSELHRMPQFLSAEAYALLQAYEEVTAMVRPLVTALPISACKEPRSVLRCLELSLCSVYSLNGCLDNSIAYVNGYMELSICMIDIMDQSDGSQGGHANVHNDKFNSSSYSKNDILEQKFDSEDDTHAFYNAYAKEMEFSIRKDRLKVDEANVPRKRKWVCSKQEKRCVHFLLSHRCVSDAVKARTKAMHNVGVKTGQIMDLKVNEAKGYGDVGFTLKDLQNKIEVERRVELKDGDAEGALGYLSARANADPLFFFKYTVDEDNQLAGVSNHFLTTIFGCALLVDETFATYTWVLETLMEAMVNKRPMSVVTDGDRAMRQAIQKVIPDCRHRLCSWHLSRNAATNIHKPEFQEDFKRCMQMDCEIDEFETIWDQVVKQYNIEQKPCMLETYSKCSLWAQAYLRGYMFAGASSAQRVEGMNAYFNQFLKLRLRLFEFMVHYDRALGRIRNREAKAEVRTENSFPVLTTPLKRLEKHGADIIVSCRGGRGNIGLTIRFHSHSKIDTTLTQIARYGILSSLFNEVSYYASHADLDFKEAREVAVQFLWRLKKRRAMTKEDNPNSVKGNRKTKLFGIGDPNIVKTKGNPGGNSSMGKPNRPRKCGRCRVPGHTKRTCPKFPLASRGVDSISIDKNDYQPSATHCPSEGGYPTPPPSPFTQTGCKRKSIGPAMTHHVRSQLYTNHEHTDLTHLESRHDINKATASRDAQVCQNGSFRISEASKEDEEGAAKNGAI
ncbi:hypothetical protein RHSIM_Rhsim04G0060700 [Rhododendron simsii]|uniref:MULE transposase domain-containing protein n=1 Tax=Rhododendron simsii TaxID=118357 RepID=A0A834LR64_RHOSS|nr:hypothetical protein RHSIM_Rhsim04G0060700 [Rhododendron simsii]